MLAGVSPSVGVMKIQQQQQAGIFDLRRQGHGIVGVIDVVVSIRRRLGLAAGEQAQAHAIDAMVFENLNAIRGHPAILIHHAQIGEIREKGKVGSGQEIGVCLRRREKRNESNRKKNCKFQPHTPFMLNQTPQNLLKRPPSSVRRQFC